MVYAERKEELDMMAEERKMKDSLNTDYFKLVMENWVPGTGFGDRELRIKVGFGRYESFATLG